MGQKKNNEKVLIARKMRIERREKKIFFVLIAKQDEMCT